MSWAKKPSLVIYDELRGFQRSVIALGPQQEICVVQGDSEKCNGLPSVFVIRRRRSILYLPVAALSMSIVSGIIIGLLTAITYGLPFFLGWQWIRKLSNVEENAPAWRRISLWVGLSACTVAVCAFWFGLFTNPHTYPDEDIHFRHFLTFDKAAVALGIGGALAGQGKGRWLVVLSGLGVGASWLWFTVLQ